MGEVISNCKKQVRIAETEKYAPVTFFLNVGEKSLLGRRKNTHPSPNVATYDMAPEMSRTVTLKICDLLKNQNMMPSLLIFNADMVGHTGDFGAAIKAIEF